MVERVNGNNQQKRCTIMKRKILIEGQNGATVVEFAIILPLLIVFIFGIIEFGLLLYNKQVITNASREGARAGLVMRVPRLTDAEIVAVVNQYAQNHLVTFGTENFPPPAILPPEGSRTGTLFGTDLSVSVTYDYNFLVLSTFLGPMTLQAVTTMKME